jgi:hypothetical protein
MSKHKDKNGQKFIRNISRYKGNERRSGNRRRTEPEGRSSRIPDDLTPLIKEFITESLENQKRLVEVRERKANGEARTIEAIKSFLTFIKDFIEGDTLKDLLTRSTAGRKPYRLRPPDAKHKNVFKIIAKMREENRTYEDIADHLVKKGIPTFSGRGNWHAQTVHRLNKSREYKIFIST